MLQCLGCSARRPLDGHPYKLVEVESQYFLAPGSSQTQGQHQKFQVSLGTSNLADLSNDKCSIRSQWFSLYPSKAATPPRWTVETPSVAAWAEAGGHVDLKPEWEKFLQEVALLKQNQCFPSTDDFSAIKQKIVGGMAMPADESLLYRYSYGQAGYVDLAPGMELRIERNVATNNRSSRKKGGSPLRTVTTSYGFSFAGASDVQINFLHSQDTSPKSGDDALKIHDQSLVEVFKTSPHLRLILQRLEVSANSNSPAILLGGAGIKDLDAATKLAVSNPKISCEELSNAKVACVEFGGLVTVSPVLNVRVNGRVTFVPLGSKVSYVFPPSPGSYSKMLKTLRILRQNDGGHMELEFTHNEEDIGQILLFGGDEISWSRSKHE